MLCIQHYVLSLALYHACTGNVNQASTVPVVSVHLPRLSSCVQLGTVQLWSADQSLGEMLNNTMLETLQSKHTTLDGLKMLMVTWNVNAKLEEAQNLRKLFFNPDEKCFGDTPEIIVLGLQEMVELSTSNVIGGSMVGNSAERVEQWRAMLLEILQAENRGFEMVTSKNMVGLWISVFALREVRVHISKIQVSSMGRGVGGVLGNKGAVYARFNVKDTSICLVCAHFAAHREHLQRRNDDFHAILNYKAFPGLLDSAGLAELTNLSPHSATAMANEAAKCGRMQERIAAMKRTLQNNRIPVSPSMNAKRELLSNFTCAVDHDIIIWIGDLNYRLLGGMENSRIYDIIDGKRSYVLLDMDQLNLEREKGTVFEGFHEGIITFDPTYKYVPGSTVGYNRERCPAWCDRVLWKLKSAATPEATGEYLEIQSPFSAKSRLSIPASATSATSADPSGLESPVPAVASVAVMAAAEAGEVAVERSELDVSDSDDADEEGPSCLPTGVSQASAETAYAPDGAPPSTADTDGARVAESGLLPTEQGEVGVAPTADETEASAQVTESGGSSDSSGELADTPLTVATDVIPACSFENTPVSSDVVGMTKPVFSKHTVPDSKVTEIVELMVYNRGENIISDHKPVRALMGIKYKKVDWAAHERHLVEAFTQRCTGRPYHDLSYRVAYGGAPVSFSPRCVTMFSSLDCTVAQKVEVRNHSGSNMVRYAVSDSSNNAIPAWMSVEPRSGIIAPGGVAVLEMVCHSTEADRSYMKSIEEDALHLEDQLQPVWRRHLRNPDERGNPQLTAVLVLDLFTHLPSAATAAPTSSGSTSVGSSDGSRAGCDGEAVVEGVPTPPVSMPATEEMPRQEMDAQEVPPAAAKAQALVSTDAECTSGTSSSSNVEEAAGGASQDQDRDQDRDQDQEQGGLGSEECVWAMTPLVVPIICRVATA